MIWRKKRSDALSVRRKMLLFKIGDPAPGRGHSARHAIDSERRAEADTNLLGDWLVVELSGR
jgi:hypothetical protein